MRHAFPARVRSSHIETIAPAGTTAPILRPGDNCWRVADASRVAMLVDGAAYFEAFVHAVLRAREQVLIVGWDIQSRARLMPEMPDGLPNELGPFLDAVVRRNRKLRVYLLDWDFSLVFALERELLPAIRLGWRTHRRVTFCLDGEHPLGACHHQKLVVVDDAVAFLGGLDLTTSRWDTSAHLPDDPLRVLPDGKAYPPFHDVQVAVSGTAAADLGRLARTRWRHATGHQLRPPRPGSDPWPPLRPDFERVPIAIVRTEPAYEGRREVREVEALYRDSIAAARERIYIENQYLTSALIRDALAVRLREPDGPEVVMVLPRCCSGWLEESTMGVMRGRLLRHLREADVHGRLRVYRPQLPDDASLNIHSKIMVVDDVLLRVASSNLSNRSMGLDTECDFALEANGDPAVAQGIARARDRLLGEQLGVSPERVAAAIAETGSLIAAVERLQGGPRTLVPLEEEPAGWLDQALPETPLVDVERPVANARFLSEVLPPELREPALRSVLAGAGTLVVLLLAAALWTWGGVPDWLSPTRLAEWAAPLRSSPLAPFVTIGAYVLGSAVMLPVTLLIMATVLLFGPWLGMLHAFLGATAAAAVTWAVGRSLWRDTIRRIAGRHVDRVSRRLGRHGVLSMAVVRLVPVAPFTIVNLVAGALHVRLDQFLAGTILGMAPGIVALALLLGSVR
jgi:phospholipase D1/2